MPLLTYLLYMQPNQDSRLTPTDAGFLACKKVQNVLLNMQACKEKFFRSSPSVKQNQYFKFSIQWLKYL